MKEKTADENAFIFPNSSKLLFSDNSFDELIQGMPEYVRARSDFFNEEDENGLHLNPNDFNRAADVPQLDPLVEEKIDPIQLAGNTWSSKIDCTFYTVFITDFKSIFFYFFSNFCRFEVTSLPFSN